MSTPEAFWAEFSGDKGHFTWSLISARLRHLRAAHDEQLTNNARSEYGERFAQVFHNRGKVMVDKTAIARRYLSLKQNLE